MKKIFIGLLLIAAGAGFYYILQHKKTETNPKFDTTLLSGTWKLDSLPAYSHDSIRALTSHSSQIADSNFRRRQFEFKEGHTFIQALTDSSGALTDTAKYTWTGGDQLTFLGTGGDSTHYLVRSLDKQHLILQSRDSSLWVFSKLK